MSCRVSSGVTPGTCLGELRVSSFVTHVPPDDINMCHVSRRCRPCAQSRPRMSSIMCCMMSAASCAACTVRKEGRQHPMSQHACNAPASIRATCESVRVRCTWACNEQPHATRMQRQVRSGQASKQQPASSNQQAATQPKSHLGVADTKHAAADTQRHSTHTRTPLTRTGIQCERRAGL